MKIYMICFASLILYTNIYTMLSFSDQAANTTDRLFNALSCNFLSQLSDIKCISKDFKDPDVTGTGLMYGFVQSRDGDDPCKIFYQLCACQEELEELFGLLLLKQKKNSSMLSDDDRTLYGINIDTKDIFLLDSNSSITTHMGALQTAGTHYLLKALGDKLYLKEIAHT